MYTNLTKNIKTSNTVGEIPTNADFSLTDDILYNIADGYVYKLVPKTVLAVKRVSKVFTQDIDNIAITASFDKDLYYQNDKVLLSFAVENSLIVKINGEVSSAHEGILELIFDVPGEYTITIHAENGDLELTKTYPINILPIPVNKLNTVSAIGDPDLPVQGRAIYIDTTYTGTDCDGTIDRPYNTWEATPKIAHVTYLFKRDTVIITDRGLGEFLNKENVQFGAYGSGTLRPHIKATATSGTAFYILAVRQYNNAELAARTSTKLVGLQISADTPSICNGLRLGSNLQIDSCYIHGATWGWRETGGKVGDPNRIKNISIKNTVIENTLDDGIYLQHVDEINLENIEVLRSNQNWKPGVDQSIAAGDGIQLNAVTRVRIKNIKIDRSDTGNKFCLIIAGFFARTDGNYLIIEDNTFISPKKTDQGGAVIYLRDFQDDNLDVVFNGNKLIGEGPYGLTGVWYQAYKGTFKSENNTYDSLGYGIQNISNSPLCTSKDDIFTNCGRNLVNVQLV